MEKSVKWKKWLEQKNWLNRKIVNLVKWKNG